jgi:tetratricopeptide (TPR) repeat protein
MRAWPTILWGTFVLTLGLAGCGRFDDGTEYPLMENLGDLHHEITTESPLAQQFFDQGLTLTYGFNHEAAVNSFKEAARLDGDCAMCFWGIALALGPNINAAMGPESGSEAYKAVQKAHELARAASDKERAFIEALLTRYSEDPEAERAPLDLAYANAMRKVHRRHPDDLDAAVLFAEALMDLSPWNYWTDQAKPGEHTEEVLRTLEGVIERNPDHPGANHYYIHAVEEHFPERAVAAADRLAGFAPDAGHLVHMPSHIYWRVGRYNDAVEINRRAAEADEAYFAWCRSQGIYRAMYYPHNVHFLWAAAAAEGQSDIALTASRKLVAQISDEQVKEYPFVEDFLPTPIFTLIRFGRWDDILGEPEPPPERRYEVGIWHYARGLAYTRKNETAKAALEFADLAEITVDDSMGELEFFGGTAQQNLKIAVRHLAGEMAAHRDDFEAAILALREAVRLQDELTYTEPPPWFFPVRQALGAVLLRAERPEEAEAVYRKDLEQYPRNGWSLFGLAESLRLQGKDDEATLVQAGFREAWARADVELTASRF